ncbi:uncharacterized protein EI90DRAFT_3123139 [Cantharellus anzutake]|uniref:uncharacterized protein n=1 Tax=Cantharellus anzutake TaxID=1750568 RepID=UPI00190527F4|nr:uncharacterized protein EI90DRAFT_3123139 [Cantharellus anzutake]KAF8332064.1 hypothetical protein EI90DRAFT_3123139 [Cantharellus anzutake]
MDNDSSDGRRDSQSVREEGLSAEPLDIQVPPPALNIELHRHITTLPRNSLDEELFPEPLLPPPLPSLPRIPSTPAGPSALNQSGSRSSAMGSHTLPPGARHASRRHSTPPRTSRHSVGATIPVRVDPLRRSWHQNLYRNIRAFFGHGDPARKRLVSTYARVIFCVAQLAIVCVFAAMSRTKWRSPRPEDNHISEWDACDKPLGPMSIVWLVRLVLGIGLIIWGFYRTRPRPEGDVEHRSSDRSRRQTTTQPSIPEVPTPQTPESQPEAGLDNTQAHNGPPPQPRTESDKLWDRLNNFTTILVMVHFSMTNYFLLSSTRTCRKSSPHLWWLTFAILALTYLIILELLMICFTVFILMPLVFIALNIVLICTGHRPISPRQMLDPGHISPDTPKMPQKLVDKIPLVLYIPAPEPANNSNTASNDQSLSTGANSKSQSPAPADPEGGEEQHVYPPTAVQSPTIEIEESVRMEPARDEPLEVISPISQLPPTPARTVKKRGRFAFLRRHRSLQRNILYPSQPGDSSPKVDEGDEEWEDLWEKSKLPFVRLEGNRAACAICLMDFDEPPRKKDQETKNGASDPSSSSAAPTSDANGPMASQAAPGEPEPLRLLECGHCFHKSCVDPWLTGVSGRCPTCQRKVEIKGRFRNKSSSSRNRQ